MYRYHENSLNTWFVKTSRKPLVLRGARHVGKTWLIRNFAKQHPLQLIELNFEKNFRLAEHFKENDPPIILKNLESEFNCKISPTHSLLFLDEIQAAPQVLSCLRWFKEEMPQLAVIAAGSLLDFVLNDHQFSMPVGRISYLYIEPLSFTEFLMVSNTSMYDQLNDVSMDNELNARLHQRLLDLYYQYCLVGGMPEVVNEWLISKDYGACLKIQQDLVSTFQDDFFKYSHRMQPGLLIKLIDSVVDQLGNKFVINRVSDEAGNPQIKKALSLLTQARLVSQIRQTSGFGIPLGAESNDRFFKMMFLDVGLIASLLRLSRLHLEDSKKFIFKNKGAMAEQFVGQQLRAALSMIEDPALFYWQRTNGRQGEIDYIIQYGTQVIPVEVKSGTAGSMKSLHQFMHDRALKLAIRCDLNPLSIANINVKTTLGDSVKYTLLSIPLYLVENISDLIMSGRFLTSRAGL